MPTPKSDETILASIQQKAYLRERLDPQPGDSLYLHLADLLGAIKGVATESPIKLLDYGAGGSPYKPLFPNADYRRADFEAIDGVDYILKGEGATIAEPDATFDLILSTQVAEHLRWPQQYFTECLRLLKPGGRLICTTHGTFEEHGVPYDYQRWTAAGLREAVTEVGLPCGRDAQTDHRRTRVAFPIGPAVTYFAMFATNTLGSRHLDDEKASLARPSPDPSPS